MKFLQTKKAKILAFISALSLGANFAMAEALKMSETGVVSGTLDPAPVFSVVTALFALFGGIVVAKIALAFVKRG